MTYLLIFIAGILFVFIMNFISPILDALSTWVQNIFGAKSVKLQVEAEKTKLEADQTPVGAIGFQYEAPVEDWEEEDDE